MKYSIYYEKSVKKDAEKLSTPSLKAIKEAIETRIATEPLKLGKPLRASWKGHRRLRVGNYRIIYRVDENIKTVFIIAFGHRKDIYEQ